MRSPEAVGRMTGVAVLLLSPVVLADSSSVSLARTEQAARAAYDTGAVDRAAALWGEAAQAGSIDAMVALAGLIESGEIVAPISEAVALYERAASFGEPIAVFRLAIVEKRQPDALTNSAHEWLCRAASAGHPSAVRMLDRSTAAPPQKSPS